jgi:acyl transferase domain-containing protein/NADPH-dependent curcumin reductase CurA
MSSTRTPSAAQLAVAVRNLRQRTADLDLASSEPLAIIGIGCRFAGGIGSPAQLWQLIRERRNVATIVPPDRFTADDLRDAGAASVFDICRGSFLADIERFDAHFFGVSPREAALMDPQQRMLLEVAWEAMDDAGVVPEKLRGSTTGVFAAIYNHDYLRYQYADPARVVAHTSSGTSPAIAAGRIAFLLDLRGPAVIFDTACSSSLVATHYACASLRNRDCDMAIVGGAGLILGPETYASLGKWGMLAPDGRCKTFDSRADGFGRGEGCGVVLIKRLADALRDGDRVRSVIRGTALNQDGRSTDLTAPNGLAQQDVIRRALRNAQVAARDIGYIEAHGTGTPLGDPIEVEALTEVLGDVAPDALPCALSSLKANIGHLEAAAGVAGLIKATLVLENALIPAQALFESPNPHLALAGTRFHVPTRDTDWPRGPAPRLAGVSSFGFSGTNAHVVLEEPPRLPAPAQRDTAGEHLLVVSARDAQSLRLLAVRHAAHLRATGDSMHDICFTAAQRRSHYEHRLAVVGASAQQLAERLDVFAQGASHGGIASGVRQRGADPRPVFVFSGQGPQWPRMGIELFETEPVFRKALEECDAALQRHSPLRLLAELAAVDGASRLGATEVAQPAIFALQTALAALWKSWGVTPAAVIGHSIGEVAAAHVCGALSLDDAARLVVHRGRLMQQATGSGRMASVELPAAEVEVLRTAEQLDVSIAAINAPGSCVVSGAVAGVEAIIRQAAARGAAWTMLPVDYAFHSAQMDPYGVELEALLRPLVPLQGGVPFISTVTAAPLDGRELGAGYWRRNLREPVQFGAAVASAMAAGHRVFLEVGPHPVLAQSMQRCAGGDAPPFTLASLRRGQPQRAAMLHALGGLFVNGLEPAWPALQSRAGRVVSLPCYAWKDERYAVPRFRDMVRARPRHREDARHPLLGTRVPLAHGAIVHETRLSTDALPFLREHTIAGRVVVPGACFVEAALELAHALWGDVACRVESIAFDQPLLPGDDAAPLLQVVAEPREGDALDFRVCSQASNTSGWTVHATGRLARGADAPPLPPDAANAVAARCPTLYSPEQLYRALAAIGPEFGPAFRGIAQLRTGVGECWADVRATPAAEGAAGFRMHPAQLDACFQVVVGALGVLAAEAVGDTVYVPVGIDRLSWFAAPTPALRVQALAARSGAASAAVDLRILDDAGRLVALVDGFRMRAVPRASMVSRVATATDDWLRELAWRDVPLRESAEASPGGWIVVDDDEPGGAELQRALIARHATVRRVSVGALLGSLDHCAGIVLLAPRGVRIDDDSSAQELQAAAAGLCREATRIALEALRAAAPPRLVLVTAGAQHVGSMDCGATALAQAALWGWRNSVALEHPALRPIAIDLDPERGDGDYVTLAGELLAGDVEDRVAYRRDRRLVGRLVQADERRRAIGAGAEIAAVRLQIAERGTFDALALRPAARRAPGPGEVEIRVHAAALNFRDVMNALGTYPGDAGALGDECAGVVVATGAGVGHLRAGDEVMAFMPGSLATYVTGLATMAVRRPANLSMEQAAGVPVVFMTAAMALERIAGLRAGQRVLIHAAAGGVGLAAVALALKAGAEVFATAGSEEKRRYLASLGVRHVMDSRSLDFSARILEITRGEGVDAVLNSLAGEFIAASFAVVRKGGHFLEIGKTGIWTEEQVARLGRGIHYSVIFLGQDRQDRPALLADLLQGLADRIDRGELRVPPVRVFALDDAVSAFRFMAQARHIGKLVLRMPAGVPVAVRPDATYLVTGGFGGLGLVAAAALVEGGARHLMLLGRSAACGVEALAAIAALEATGCTVHRVACDIGAPGAVDQVAAALRALPPLRGIVHGAGIIDDAPLDATRWDAVMTPKVAGSWNLHQLSLRVPVEFLMVFSAGAALLGSSGQANYAAANSVMDALASHRRARGLPALAVHWGRLVGCRHGREARRSRSRALEVARHRIHRSGGGRAAHPRAARLVRGSRRSAACALAGVCGEHPALGTAAARRAGCAARGHGRAPGNRVQVAAAVPRGHSAAPPARGARRAARGVRAPRARRRRQFRTAGRPAVAGRGARLADGRRIAQCDRGRGAPLPARDAAVRLSVDWRAGRSPARCAGRECRAGRPDRRRRRQHRGCRWGPTTLVRTGAGGSARRHERSRGRGPAAGRTRRHEDPGCEP